MNQARLFVGNISFHTRQPDLLDYFSQAGLVRSVDLMMDKSTGRSRGYAFVELGSEEEALKAVEMFHSKSFQGRSLTVSIARPRGERDAQGGEPGQQGHSERTRPQA